MKLFDEAPQLASLVARGKRNKKTRKIVNGVSVRLAWAGSATSLASDQAGDIYIDEFDKMVGGVKGDADAFTLAKARADTYADRKIAVTSTPKRGTVETERDEKTGLEFWKMAEPADLESPIWAKWQSGTRHHWAWRCPHCDGWFIPRVNLLKCDKGASATQARRNTWLECPVNGCVILEADKTAMNAAGAFVAPGMTISDDGEIEGEVEDNTNYSLWVSGLASPFLTWGERLEEIINAEAMGDSEARQGAQNKIGELWSPLGGDVPDWQAIMNRREPYSPQTIPDEALRLTLTAYVQDDRIPFVIRAWGARATSWLIEYGELLGNTALTPVWGMLAEKLTTPIDGIPIHLAFVDSGFRPGKKFTLPLNRVYQFCRRFRRVVYPTKGSSHAMIKPLAKAKADVNRKGDVDKYGLELIRLVIGRCSFTNG
jgi:phage terminase large subunit GpA-like protein